MALKYFFGNSNTDIGEEMGDALATITFDTVAVYRGIQPLGPLSFDPADFTSDLLLLFTSLTIARQTSTSGTFLLSGTANASASLTNTATWCAVYNAATPANAILGPATLGGGGGIAALNALSLTATTSYTLEDVRFTASVV